MRRPAARPLSLAVRSVTGRRSACRRSARKRLDRGLAGVPPVADDTPVTCSSGDEDPDALTEIGHARLDEFGETGDERVLAAAVAAYERALEVLPPGEEQWTFLSNLGNALREVYEASRDRTALDRAGDLLERALHGLSSEDADRAVVLDNRALVLRDRYGDLGYLDELRKAAELHEDALAAYGDGPERARYLNNLGGALWELYGATGDAALLEPASSAFEAAVAVAPARSPDAGMYLSNLASALLSTYRHSGGAALLRRALDVARRALDLTGATAPDRGRQLSTLAQLLMERYDLAGDLDDVNDAIALFGQAVELSSPRTTRHAGMCSNLGEALLARFEGTGDPTDLERSVHLLEGALNLARQNSADPTRFVASLGGALGARYGRRGDRQDLNRAIELLTLAVAASPDHGSAPPTAATRRHSLGLLLEGPSHSRATPRTSKRPSGCSVKRSS